MIEWQTAKPCVVNSQAIPTPSNEGFSMNYHSPNQRCITAGPPSTLKTESMTQNLRKNNHEKQGYNCGYRTQLRDSFTAYSNHLDYYFDDRRGHQISS